MNKTKIQEMVAKHLLDIKAVFLRPNEPFIWASGIKSPIYCDNRLTLSDPKIRKNIEKALAKTIKMSFPDVEAVVGTSTAGIPHAAIVGHMLKLPMGYVRTKAKDHGRQNRIEGNITKGTKVVVIEDLVSTGGSCIDVAQHLQESGINVIGIVSIFTYGMKASIDNFANNNLKFCSLTNLDTIVNVAIKNSYIKEEDKTRLLKFRDNPKDESWIKG